MVMVAFYAFAILCKFLDGRRTTKQPDEYSVPVEPEKKPGAVVNAPDDVSIDEAEFPCFNSNGRMTGACVLYILQLYDIKDMTVAHIYNNIDEWVTNQVRVTATIKKETLPEGKHDYTFLTMVIGRHCLKDIILACRTIFPDDPMTGYFKLQSFRPCGEFYAAALFLYTGKVGSGLQDALQRELRTYLEDIVSVLPEYNCSLTARSTPLVVFSYLVPYSKAKEAESKLRLTLKNDAAKIVMEGDLRNQELKNQLKELQYIGRGMEHRQSMHFVLKVVIWAFAIMHLIFLSPVRTDIHLMGFVVCMLFLFMIPDCDTTKTRTIFVLCLVMFVLLMGIHEDVSNYWNSDVKELCADIDGENRTCNPDEKAMNYLLNKCKHGMIGQFLVPLFGTTEFIDIEHTK